MIGGRKYINMRKNRFQKDAEMKIERERERAGAEGEGEREWEKNTNIEQIVSG